MSLVIPQVNLGYFQQQLPKGRRALMSQLEIACAIKPEYIGTVEAQEVAYDTYAGFLMASGNEMTVAADQLTWREKPSETNVIQIVGQNLVSRSGNNFKINTAAIPTNPYDIDTCRPENARFFTAEGQRFLVVDNTGKRNVGVVESLSNDGKTITAAIRDENESWTVATTNLDIIFWGFNLDHCQCPPSIGYKYYAETLENSFTKDGDAARFCEETLVAEGGWSSFREKIYGDVKVTPASQVDDAQKRLMKKTDATLAWDVRTPLDVAGGEPQGIKGIFQQLDQRAVKFEGEILTLDDLVDISSYLKKKDVYEAYLDATPSQYIKLMNIMRSNVSIQWNPWENHQSDLMYLGYKGVDIYGVKIMFREWKGLSGRGSEKLGKAYNFLITPADKVNITLNNKTTQVGHVTLVWFGNENDPYKMKRFSNENDYNCGNIDIKFVNKYSVVVAGADRFIMGINPAA